MSVATLITGLLILLTLELLVVFFFLAFSNSIRNTRDLVRTLSLTAVRVTLPNKRGMASNCASVAILMEKMFALLSGLKSRGRFLDRLIFEEPYLALEVMVEKDNQTVMLAFPRHFEDYIKHSIYSVFEDAEISYETGDGPFKGPAVAISTLGIELDEYLPLANPTTKTLGLNLSDIINSGESAALQLLIRPAPVAWNANALRRADSVLKSDDLRRSIRQKASLPVFQTNFRLAGSGASEVRAFEIVRALEKRVNEAFIAGANRLTTLETPQEELGFNFAFKVFNRALAIPLSTRELAQVCQFETAAKIKDSDVKEFPGGTDIKIGEKVGEAMALVGFTDKQARFEHCYVVGQTGTGKSGLLLEMIRQDLERGRGVAVIDPHGDLAEAILKIVPPTRAAEVVYFDPADIEYPMGFNILEASNDEEKDFLVQEIISVFEKLFPKEFLGPIFEHNLRNTLLTLMAGREPGTLAEIPRILTDPDYAKLYINQLKDDLVRNFWQKERAAMTQADRAEVVPYIVSKIGRFIENKTMRHILSQRHSSLDLAEILEKGQILIVNLSKGKLGELNAALLGLLIMAKLQAVVFGQAAIPDKERRDFWLYIDEFQNFTTNTIASIFSEARKYHLSLTVAHQFTRQLIPEVRDAIFGNVGSVISFRVGADDARILAAAFGRPHLEKELLNLNNYEALIRLRSKKAGNVIFERIRAREPQVGVDAMAEAIKKTSRLRYGRPLPIVEREIASMFL